MVRLHSHINKLSKTLEENHPLRLTIKFLFQEEKDHPLKSILKDVGSIKGWNKVIQSHPQKPTPEEFIERLQKLYELDPNSVKVKTHIFRQIAPDTAALLPMEIKLNDVLTALTTYIKYRSRNMKSLFPGGSVVTYDVLRALTDNLKRKDGRHYIDLTNEFIYFYHDKTVPPRYKTHFVLVPAPDFAIRTVASHLGMKDPKEFGRYLLESMKSPRRYKVEEKIKNLYRKVVKGTHALHSKGR